MFDLLDFPFVGDRV